jgi:hypothetical protein
LPEQIGLIAHRTQIRQTIAAIGEHHRQIADHAPRIVPAIVLAQPRERVRQRRRQPNPISDPSQQAAAGMRDQARSVRRDFYRETAPIAHHLQGEPPE